MSSTIAFLFITTVLIPMTSSECIFCGKNLTLLRDHPAEFDVKMTEEEQNKWMYTFGDDDNTTLEIAFTEIALPLRYTYLLNYWYNLSGLVGHENPFGYMDFNEKVVFPDKGTLKDKMEFAMAFLYQKLKMFFLGVYKEEQPIESKCLFCGKNLSLLYDTPSDIDDKLTEDEQKSWSYTFSDDTGKNSIVIPFPQLGLLSFSFTFLCMVSAKPLRYIIMIHYWMNLKGMVPLESPYDYYDFDKTVKFPSKGNSSSQLTFVMEFLYRETQKVLLEEKPNSCRLEEVCEGSAASCNKVKQCVGSCSNSKESCILRSVQTVSTVTYTGKDSSKELNKTSVSVEEHVSCVCLSCQNSSKNTDGGILC